MLNFFHALFRKINLAFYFLQRERHEIFINHITGMGTSGGTGGDGGEKSAVNQAVDGVLNMALQLPAVKKLGEEVGLNISDGLSGISGPLEGDETEKKDEE